VKLTMTTPSDYQRSKEQQDRAAQLRRELRVALDDAAEPVNKNETVGSRV
jgi:hypothetical protein